MTQDPDASGPFSVVILGIRMEKNDPAGDYKIKAKVSDLNADISFELETKIRLE